MPFPKILVVQLALGVVGLEMVKVATSVVDAGVATGDAMLLAVSASTNKATLLRRFNIFKFFR